MSELNQCPCNPACKCLMGEPCLGCETYGEWLNRQPDQELVAALEEIARYTKDSLNHKAEYINAQATKALAKYKTPPSKGK